MLVAVRDRYRSVTSQQFNLTMGKKKHWEEGMIIPEERPFYASRRGLCRGLLGGAVTALSLARGEDLAIAKKKKGKKKPKGCKKTACFEREWGGLGSGDGQFNYPASITAAPNGDVFVGDFFKFQVQRFSASGEFILQWSQVDGELLTPDGIAATSDGDIYVSNFSDTAYRFSATGNLQGSLDVDAVPAIFNPTALAVAPNGNVYAVEAFQVAQFDADGGFVRLWGESGSLPGQFNLAAGIAVAANGEVYVADTGNNRIQRFSASGAFIGQWGGPGSGPGQLNEPEGIAIASKGNVYVSDTGNNRVQKFSRDGDFLGQWGVAGDGPGEFNRPLGIAVARKGQIYVVDNGNRRIQEFAPQSPKKKRKKKRKNGR